MRSYSQLVLISAIFLLTVEGDSQNATEELAGANIAGAKHALELISKHNPHDVEKVPLITEKNKCQARNEKWECAPDCFMKYKPETGYCQAPVANQTCFGIPIDYHYIRRQSFSKSDIERFEIIKRFPECWSKIAPILCASVYHPCHVTQCYAHGLNDSNSFTCEVWRVFSTNECNHAMHSCRFVVELGLWPEFVNCKKQVDVGEKTNFPRANVSHVETFFPHAGNCQIVNYEKPQTLNSQCLWPLVNTTSSIDTSEMYQIDTVMDHCFLPCKSPLLNDGDQFDNLRSWNIFFSAIFIGASIFMIVYIHHKKNLLVFGIPFGFALLYYATWLSGSLNSVAEFTQCVDNSSIRRTEIRSWDVCEAQVGIMTIFFVAMITYSLGFSITLFRFKEQRLERFVAGRLSALYMTLLPFIAGLVVYWFIAKQSIDGLTGVCYFQKELFIYLMGIYVAVDFLMIILDVIFRYLNRKKFNRNFYNSLEGGLKALNKNKTHELTSFTNETATNIVDVESQPTATESVPNKSGQQVTETSNGNALHEPNSERENLISSSKSKKDRRSVKEQVLILKQKLAQSYPNSPMHRLLGYDFHEFIFIVCRMCMLFICLLCLFFVISPFALPSTYEKDAIIASIECSLRSTIGDYDTYWILSPSNLDYKMGSSDPYMRKLKYEDSINAPNCDLKTMSTWETWKLTIMWLIIPGMWLLMCSWQMMFNVKLYPRFENPIVSGETEAKDDELELQCPYVPNTDTISLYSAHLSEADDQLSELPYISNASSNKRKRHRSAGETGEYSNTQSPMQRSMSAPNFHLSTMSNSDSVSVENNMVYINLPKLLAERQDLMTEVNMLLKTVKTTTDTLVRNDRIVESLNVEKFELKERVEELTTEVDKLRNENMMLENRVEELRTTIEMLQNPDDESYDAQSSASSMGSNDYDSDEPDSEEERDYEKRKNQYQLSDQPCSSNQSDLVC